MQANGNDPGLDRSCLRHPIAALLFAAALAGCVAPDTREDDPLVGQIVDAGGAVAVDALMDRLASADVVYLGEKHDNPWHHTRQREVVEALVARGRQPALAFEVFPVADTGALMLYATAGKGPKGHGDPEARLRRSLGWTAENHENWRRYGPLLRVAREQGLVAFGIDLPVSLRRRISRVGVAALTPVERGSLAPDDVRDDPVYRRLMFDRIRTAHCGYGSADYLGRLYESWNARNATMAQAIDRALDGDRRPVIVIVGAEHPRFGKGVLERVAALRLGVRQVNVGLLEVAPASAPLDAYLDPLVFEGHTFAPAHDVLWFTPRVPALGKDRCAAFGHTVKTGG